VPVVPNLASQSSKTYDALVVENDSGEEVARLDDSMLRIGSHTRLYADSLLGGMLELRGKDDLSNHEILWGKQLLVILEHNFDDGGISSKRLQMDVNGIQVFHPGESLYEVPQVTEHSSRKNEERASRFVAWDRAEGRKADLVESGLYFSTAGRTRSVLGDGFLVIFGPDDEMITVTCLGVTFFDADGSPTCMLYRDGLRTGAFPSEVIEVFDSARRKAIDGAPQVARDPD